MLLTLATEADFAEIVALANLAYRGTGTEVSWNVENGYLGGQRLDESLLKEDLAAKPSAQLLTLRDPSDGTLLGTVWLDPGSQHPGSQTESGSQPESDGIWYLGLLTVRPDRQNRQLGRSLLAAAERFASERGACRIRMTVIHLRDALIAWYERRGYALTGQTAPFPYGDERYGLPMRDDLHFVVLEKDLTPAEFRPEFGY